MARVRDSSSLRRRIVLVLLAGLSIFVNAAWSLPPNISSISPTSGAINVLVQVNGTGFGSTKGSSTLTFNGVTANPSLWSDTKLITELPATISTGPVKVTVGGIGSNTVIFTLLTTGTITGKVTKRSDGTGIANATVGAYLANILQVSTNTATDGSFSFLNMSPGAYVLICSASGYSSVTTPPIAVNAGGTSTINTSMASPIVTSLSPAAGPVGTLVTISGLYFGPIQGSSTVTFHGTASTVSRWSDTSIDTSVPTGATTGAVVLSVGGASSNQVTFTVGTGQFVGTVTQSGGGAISGATVKALQYGVVKRSATSAANGSYTLGSLSPGIYDLIVSAPGYGTVIQNGQQNNGGPTTVNFSISSTPGTVSGIVTKPDGTTAISNATVKVYQGFTTAGSATTNGSGNYSVGSLGSGTYSIDASKSGFITRTNSGVAVNLGATTSSNFALPSQDVVTYVYDEASKLVGVVDQNSNSALYSYDAAGNVQSIGNKASNLVSIIDFSPNGGPTGTPVTISGTGFSTTPAQNVVRFNGISAIVASSTATQISTNVPALATTGTITVTSPSGNATSSSSFTVTGSNGLPSITSFTPGLVLPKTAVTITGTNFDPVANNDTLTINLTKTFASSATSQTIATSIPGVLTTGHITVTNTLGSSVPTADYLFIAPSQYGLSDVGYTGQVSLGGQVTATLSTANKVGLVALDVADGNGLWLTVTNNFSSYLALTIYDPYGNALGGVPSLPPGTTSNIKTTRPVPNSGTCVILVVPGNGTGNVVLSPIAIPPDPTLPITVDGGSVAIATNAVGQNAHLTFSGTSQEKLVLTASTPIGSNPSGASVSMFDHTINQQIFQTNAGASGSGWTLYSGLKILGSTGGYSIDIQPYGSGQPWGATFQLLSVPADPTSPITLDGVPVAIATTAIGQSAHLTFSATALQRLVMLVSNPTGSNPSGAAITMSDRTNGHLVIMASGGGSGSGWSYYSGLHVLESTGPYTIDFTPNGSGLPWGATFQLLSVPADPTSLIVLDGAPVAIATTALGQSAHLTFNATANQQLYMSVSTPTGSNPSGAAITMSDRTDNSLVIQTQGGASGSGWTYCSGLHSLAHTGPYTIDFTPGGAGQSWGATFQIMSTTCQ